MAAPGAPAGWYDDPRGEHRWRWWDGVAWTEAVHDEDPAVPSATPAGTRRAPGAWIAVGVVAVVALVATVVVLTGDDEPSTTVVAAGTAVVDPAGGTVIADPGDGLAPVTFAVPPGALTRPYELSVEVVDDADGGPDAHRDDPRVWDALARWALESDTPVLHPITGPHAVMAHAEPTGVAVELGPDGLLLTEPGRVTVPLARLDLPEGAIPVVLLESGGQWEVLDDVVVDRAAGTLSVAVPHFSVGFIWRILGNIASNPFISVPNETFTEAARTLHGGRFDEVWDSIRRTLACTEGSATDLSQLPTSASDLLSKLFAGGGRVGTYEPAAANRVRDHLQQHYARALDAEAARLGLDEAGRRELNRTFSPNDVTFEQAVQLAMAETGDDPFQALVLLYEVLAVNRESPGVQRSLELVRGDGGDERGARYHLLGSAIYSFVYEHLRASGQTNVLWPPSPGMAIRLEEGWVSGDITTDTVEYVVDVNGVRLGRTLYQDLTRTGDTQALAALCEDADDEDGQETTDPPMTEMTLPPGVEVGTGDVQVTLQWTGGADMDLHVTDPAGEHIFYGDTTSASGGQLDHDDRAGCGSNVGAHVENVFWPTGGAPTGTYEVYVRNWRGCDDAAQVAQYQVRVEGVVVLTDAVSLEGGAASDPRTFTVGGP